MGTIGLIQRNKDSQSRLKDSRHISGRFKCSTIVLYIVRFSTDEY